MSKANVKAAVSELNAGTNVFLGQFYYAKLSVSIEGIGLAGGTPAKAEIVESEDGLRWDELIPEFEISNEVSVFPVTNTKKFLAIKMTGTAGVTAGEVCFKVTES
jgi:hypothetical protein